mmetsp:Transcript_89931/g.232220  ORF Transcript_89931/g.232220 Transcript_89931/m.232220 type:complete len:281 (-) Transcript_89931:155-997(-)
MGSIRRGQRQLLRCVGTTSRGLGFEQADSPSSTPSVQTSKLFEAGEVASTNGGTGEFCHAPAESSDKVVSCEDSLYWQEMFSSLSMLAPSLYAHIVCEAFAAQYTAFRPGIYVLVCSTYVHCACSMYYHANNALREGEPGFDPYNSPFRVADIGAIHFCCVTFGWALSDGAPLFTFVLVLLNLSWVRRLVQNFRRGQKGNRGDGLRIGVGILLYTSPMLLRGDVENYLGAMFFFLLAGFCWLVAPRYNGWPHGVFHLLLTPYFHFLLRSVAGMKGAAPFL